MMTFELRVRSYELDSFGHVNNAVYLQYLEAARGNYMNQVGLSVMNFHEWKTFPVVTKANIEYRAALVADDDILINGDVVDMRRATFAINYRMIRKSDGLLVMVARTEFVFVNREGKPVKIPEPFRKAFGGDG